MEKDYVCYIISNPRNHTYVGITNNLTKRLRQHNGEIVGGARRTRGNGPWILQGFVKGFSSKRHVLQFEWRMHHARRKRGKSPLEKRMFAMNTLLTTRPYENCVFVDKREEE